MKTYLVRIAGAFLGFAALAITAKAQVPDQAVIKMTHEFVVAGTTLPAGTYRVNRVSSSDDRQLILSSFENRTAVFVLPIEIESTRADKPGFTFELVGGQYFLTKIETSDHVFAVAVSKVAVLEAAAKSHQGSANSGVSGTD